MADDKSNVLSVLEIVTENKSNVKSIKKFVTSEKKNEKKVSEQQQRGDVRKRLLMSNTTNIISNNNTG